MRKVERVKNLMVRASEIDQKGPGRCPREILLHFSDAEKFSGRKQFLMKK